MVKASPQARERRESQPGHFEAREVRGRVLRGPGGGREGGALPCNQAVACVDAAGEGAAAGVGVSE